MIHKKSFVLLISIIITLYFIPNVSAPGTYTVDIYEAEREVIFQENEESHTTYIDGIVNYTGVSATPYTIELTSHFELGESSISPESVTFQVTGSEEFTVELIIPNIYENGTNDVLAVAGQSQDGISTVYIDHAKIVIINYSHSNDNNNNLNDSENHQQDDFPTGITDIFMISVIIIIIAIIIIVIYKKKSK